MSRTISELTAGTIIYLDETVDGTLAHVPYYYLGTDSSGNCIVLRQYAGIQKRMHSSNEATYDGCEADLWLEDEDTGFMSRFDTATKAAIVSTQIKVYDATAADVTTIARRCFLLSYTEVGNSSSYDEGSSYMAALKTATGATSDNNARICYNKSGSAVYWWLRSPNSSTQFRLVNASGVMGSNGASNAICWLRPALSVAPATIVSDEGEDTIYLLPDSSKTYREVDATVYVGSSANRPKQARVIVEAENCTELQLSVSNNCKDASPVWVSIDNGGVATLSNATKTTDNWEIGVKIYAKSGGKAKIGEPVVLVATE